MEKILLFVCILLANNTHATIGTPLKKTVNVTAFYGFLEDPKIKEAVECHFEELAELPKIIRLHYVKEEVFTL